MGMIGLAVFLQTFGGALKDPLGNLPLLMDAVPCQVSSHDRTGGNNDGFDGSYSFLRLNARGEFVIFEEKGPGVVSHMWFTAPQEAERIRFYFEGEEEPRIDLPIMELFSGRTYPFLRPLVGDDNVSSGGFYVYLPMPFRDGLTIATTGLGRFYHITYLKFRNAHGVETFSPQLSEEEDLLLYATVGRWQRCGELADVVSERAGAESSCLLHSTRIEPASGPEQVLFEAEGPGEILAIEVSPIPEGSWEMLRDWVLLGYWDGAEEPAIESPLIEFFGGTSFQPIDYRALPMGMTSDRFYCTFRMPFANGARFVLRRSVSQFPDGVEFRVHYRRLDRKPRRGVGRFHARNSEQIAERGKPIEILRRSGRGHFVGVTMSMKNPENNIGYLEGDEIFYVDGRQYPNLYGTGTEDYYNAGWYFNRGTFSLPFHGHHYRKTEAGEIGVYRFHVLDPIPYQEEIQCFIEHGGGCDVPETRYRQTAYWYEAPGAEQGELLEIPYPPASRVRVIRPALKTEELIRIARETKTSGPPLQLAMPEVLDPGIVGGPLLYFQAEGAEDYVEFPREVEIPDRYTLRMKYCRGPDFGCFRLQVNGQYVGDEVDACAPQFETDASVDFGEFDLEPGSSTVRLVITGKNPKSHGFGLVFPGVDFKSLANYAREWWVLGPFDLGEDRSFFKEVHEVERGPIDLDAVYTGKNGVEVRWQRAEAGKDGVVNLDGMFPEVDQGVAFAYTNLVAKSPSAPSSHLFVGSDDGVRVYFGGEKIHEKPEDRPMTIDEDRIPVEYEAGVTPILLKVYDNAAGWAFSLRLNDPEGNLEFHPDPPAEEGE